jgi:hypothetical protein
MRGHPTRECDGANGRSGVGGSGTRAATFAARGFRRCRRDVLGDIRRSRQCIALRRPMPDGKQASRLMADVKSADQTVIQSEHMDGICVE